MRAQNADTIVACLLHPLRLVIAGQETFTRSTWLAEGKRFDLGLYEAGSSKPVAFPGEGVSYPPNVCLPLPHID